METQPTLCRHVNLTKKSMDSVFREELISNGITQYGFRIDCDFDSRCFCECVRLGQREQQCDKVSQLAGTDVVTPCQGYCCPAGNPFC